MEDSKPELEGETRTFTLHMATGGPIVLVIDDNEGLVELEVGPVAQLTPVPPTRYC